MPRRMIRGEKVKMSKREAKDYDRVWEQYCKELARYAYYHERLKTRGEVL